MLIRFTVENYLSFNAEVALSMVAGKYRLLPHHIIKRSKRNDVNLLKAAVIYGANASGKSNLVKAIEFGKNIIVEGTKTAQKIPVKIFKLDAEKYQEPTKLQYEIKVKEKIYSYGFSLDSSRIHSEWLQILGRGQYTSLFERKTNENNQVDVNISKNLYSTTKEKNFLEFVAQGTRPNQLFLTEAVQRNVSHFKDVYEWFSEKLKIIFPDSSFAGLELFFKQSEVIGIKKSEFLNILKAFDTGISNVLIKQYPINKINLPPEIKEKIEKTLIKENQVAIVKNVHMKEKHTISRSKDGELIALKLFIQHKMKNSKEEVTFDLSEESDGTIRMMDFIPALTDLQINDDVYIIDEIDRSLHPHITTAILDIFLNRNKPHNNQLIVTTHESNLLNFDLLRRDEIWFVNKNEYGESEIFSLEEFKPRYDKDIRKGYLFGRFGAIPSLRKLRRQTSLIPNGKEDQHE